MLAPGRPCRAWACTVPSPRPPIPTPSSVTRRSGRLLLADRGRAATRATCPLSDRSRLRESIRFITSVFRGTGGSACDNAGSVGEEHLPLSRGYSGSRGRRRRTPPIGAQRSQPCYGCAMPLGRPPGFAPTCKAPSSRRDRNLRLRREHRSTSARARTIRWMRNPSRQALHSAQRRSLPDRACLNGNARICRWSSLSRPARSCRCADVL